MKAQPFVHTIATRSQRVMNARIPQRGCTHPSIAHKLQLSPRSDQTTEVGEQQQYRCSIGRPGIFHPWIIPSFLAVQSENCRHRSRHLALSQCVEELLPLRFRLNDACQVETPQHLSPLFSCGYLNLEAMHRRLSLVWSTYSRPTFPVSFAFTQSRTYRGERQARQAKKRKVRGSTEGQR